MAAHRTLIGFVLAAMLVAASLVPAAAQTPVVALQEYRGPRTVFFYDNARAGLDALVIPASQFAREGTLAEGVNALCRAYFPTNGVEQSECLRFGGDWAGQYELAAYALTQGRAALEAGNTEGEEVWYLFAIASAR